MRSKNTHFDRLFPANWGRWKSRWQGWFWSLLAHFCLVGLIVLQETRTSQYSRAEQGGGGASRIGGGGGREGSGSSEAGNRNGADKGYEAAIHYVQMSAGSMRESNTATTAAETEKKVSPKETLDPVPESPVKPPLERVEPPSLPKNVESGDGSGRSQVDTGLSGSGSGSGEQRGSGSGGVGPGSGGGTGSGSGTGRGSDTGEGTGGGEARNYPPTPRQLFLPPLPAPKKVQGFKLVAWFHVDSLGTARLLRFTPTPDGNYNKRLRETLLNIRFRPAVTPEGRPISDTVDIEFVF